MARRKAVPEDGHEHHHHHHQGGMDFYVGRFWAKEGLGIGRIIISANDTEKVCSNFIEKIFDFEPFSSLKYLIHKIVL